MDSRLDFMKSVSRIVPNMCRILAHRYLQAFYIDWAQKVLPDILIKVSAVYTDWVHKFLETTNS